MPDEVFCKYYKRMSQNSLLQQLGSYAAPGFAEFFNHASNDTQTLIAKQFKDFGVEELFREFNEAVAYDNAIRTKQPTNVELLPPTKISFKDLGTAWKTQTDSPAQTLSLAGMAGCEIEELRSVGLQALKQGSVAIVILAGGQGTRLGYSGPKGNYPLALPSKSTIYAILMKRIYALRKIVGNSNPNVYIMTSEQNDAETRAHFARNSYFGLGADTVHFFVQTVMPSFDKTTGAVLFESETKITRNPNGNGGIFASLKNSKMLEHMTQHGVEYIHVHGIDNVIVKSGDPIFLGACIRAGVGAGNKCCTKRSPTEKVGVQVNKKIEAANSKTIVCPSVVEYTEISEDQANQRDSDGNLKFSAANIVNHFFRLADVLEIKMQYHVAYKKVEFYDFELKRIVKPTEPNAVKLEYFIFDAFENMKGLLVFEGSREEEFSPVKNAEGQDSPATACQDICKLHKKYLLASGLIEQNDPKLYEIEPGATYAGEGLNESVKMFSFES